MGAIARAQAHMLATGVDAWLVYDFRGSNPVLSQLLEAKPETTRRCFLVIPVRGEPRLLVHAIEAGSFKTTPFECVSYNSRDSLTQRLKAALAECGKVAMEYSPGGELPTVSWVDAGTIEMVRSTGVEVVSSADLFQAALATWSGEALESHLSASKLVAQVKEEAFDYIRCRLAEGAVFTECDVQAFISERFGVLDLEADHAPIVAVNEHSGDAHYDPQPASCSEIREGDWVLIDLWARHAGESNLFADITWVGFAGRSVPQENIAVFDIVRRARDLVVDELRNRLARGEAVEGWELDAVARGCITAAGYGPQFVHRTGHSLGPGPRVHGMGANLDDLETHDTRQILPGSGFTVEPGIYLREFGVRLEIDVYVDQKKGPQVTTPIQNEVTILI